MFIGIVGWTRLEGVRLIKRNALVVVAIAASILLAAAPGFASTTLFLGGAQSFAVLGGSTVTNTGSSVITGDVGVWSFGGANAITGFYPPGIVTPPSTIYAGGAVPQAAQGSLTAAYNALAGLAHTPANVLTGLDLGGLTLTPGVYFFASSAQLTGTLTLDAQHANNVFWVFQIGSTLTTAGASKVLMTNLGSNFGDDDGLFWQVGSSATLGATTTFKGNILADQSITLTTGATIENGRALARTGAVTLDSNTVSRVSPPTFTDGGFSGGLGFDTITGRAVPILPEPASVVLLVSGLTWLLALRRRARTAAR